MKSFLASNYEEIIKTLQEKTQQHHVMWMYQHDISKQVQQKIQCKNVEYENIQQPIRVTIEAQITVVEL